MQDSSSSHSFGPVKVRLTSEEVTRRMAESIRRGTYCEGELLPPERTLATLMEVSRPTIREAIKTLVSAGILSVRPGAKGGVRVDSEVVPLELVHVMTDPKGRHLEDVLELRRVFFPWVARTAANNATETDFEGMADAVAFAKRALRADRSLTVIEKNTSLIGTMRFDLALARSTNNGLAPRLMEELLLRIEPLRYRTLTTRTELLASIDQIEQTFNAVKKRDASLLEKSLTARLEVLELAYVKEYRRALRWIEAKDRL